MVRLQFSDQMSDSLKLLSAASDAHLVIDELVEKMIYVLLTHKDLSVRFSSTYFYCEFKMCAIFFAILLTGYFDDLFEKCVRRVHFVVTSGACFMINQSVASALEMHYFSITVIC